MVLQEFVESKVLAMLSHFWHESQTGSSLHKRTLAARDAFAYSLLWSTELRGTNASHQCTAQPALASIYPSFTLAAGSKVELVPHQPSVEAPSRTWSRFPLSELVDGG